MSKRQSDIFVAFTRCWLQSIVCLFWFGQNYCILFSPIHWYVQITNLICMNLTCIWLESNASICWQRLYYIMSTRYLDVKWGFAAEMAMHYKIIRREMTMNIDLKCPFLSVKWTWYKMFKWETRNNPSNCKLNICLIMILSDLQTYFIMPTCYVFYKSMSNYRRKLFKVMCVEISTFKI
jgi:hypothetical protein